MTEGVSTGTQPGTTVSAARRPLYRLFPSIEAALRQKETELQETIRAGAHSSGRLEFDVHLGATANQIRGYAETLSFYTRFLPQKVGAGKKYSSSEQHIRANPDLARDLSRIYHIAHALLPEHKEVDALGKKLHDYCPHALEEVLADKNFIAALSVFARATPKGMNGYGGYIDKLFGLEASATGIRVENPGSGQRR